MLNKIKQIVKGRKASLNEELFKILNETVQNNSFSYEEVKKITKPLNFSIPTEIKVISDYKVLTDKMYEMLWYSKAEGSYSCLQMISICNVDYPVNYIYQNRAYFIKEDILILQGEAKAGRKTFNEDKSLKNIVDPVLNKDELLIFNKYRAEYNEFSLDACVEQTIYVYIP